MKKLIPLLLVLVSGCSVIKMSTVDGQRKVSSVVMVPAWPWQNSHQVVDRLTLSMRTNSTTFSLRAQQEQSSDTNFWAGMGTMLGTALKTAK